jgi:hypothetical protein
MSAYQTAVIMARSWSRKACVKILDGNIHTQECPTKQKNDLLSLKNQWFAGD